MIRGQLKDKKAYDFSNNKGKGKKMGLEFSINSSYYEQKKQVESEKIFNLSGVSISGKSKKLSVKNEKTRINSHISTFSPSRKLFPEKRVLSSRIINPKLQSIDDAVSMNRYKSFEFSDEPSEFRVNSSVGKK